MRFGHWILMLGNPPTRLFSAKKKFFEKPPFLICEDLKRKTFGGKGFL